MHSRPPAITGVLETAIYVDDMEATVAFYRDVLGLGVLDASPRLVALSAGPASVLLVFRRGTTSDGAQAPGGWIPGHESAGPSHLAFAIERDALDAWEHHLAECRVEIESRVAWPRGGRSLYLRDPAGHSVELVTPGTWANY
jgi:catechol 2,3-dioxygenase-like lactoylglutathione lyase family enzyme